MSRLGKRLSWERHHHVPVTGRFQCGFSYAQYSLPGSFDYNDRRLNLQFMKEGDLKERIKYTIKHKMLNLFSKPYRKAKSEVVED